MTNLALNARVTCNGTPHQTNVPQNITDGKKDTGYLESKESTPFESTIYLGNTCTIQSIHIYGFFFGSRWRTKDISVKISLGGIVQELGNYVVNNTEEPLIIQIGGKKADTVVVSVTSGYAQYYSFGLAEVEVYGESNVIPYKNASLSYTIPMSTTQKIKAKVSDKRVGLLGLAYDDENFGDLYVVGKDGKAHLTKSGIKSEVLFDGVANTVNIPYSIAKNYDEFKYLLVEFENDKGYSNQSKIIQTSSISGKDNQFSAGHYYQSSYYYDIHFGFTGKDEFIVQTIRSVGWTGLHIKKIVGIY